MFDRIDENVMLLSSRFLEQKEYWMNKLSGFIEETEILFPGSKPPTSTSDKSTDKTKINIRFSHDLSCRLMKLSKQSDLSLYILLLVGLKSLIHRYTGSDDIIVVSPLHRGKISKETINSRVFIRDRVKGEMTFKDLILKTRVSVLEAYGNQDYPYDRLLGYLTGTPGSHPGGKRPSGIACCLKNIHDEKNIRELQQTAKISFSFSREQEQVISDMVFDGNSYEKYYMERMTEHFLHLLENAIPEVETKIAKIPFLPGEEKQRLLEDFNRTWQGYPEEKTLHRLFEEQVSKFPGNTAVEGHSLETGRHLSLGYKELNEKANPLALRLRKRGVKPDTIVGLLMDRSLEMIISILGILKAGAAYLPIEPEYPHARIKYMLKDTCTRLVLTQEKYIDKVAPGIEAIPIEDSEIYRGDRQNPPPVGKTGDLAYIIYTSGTTGKPKGVMTAHFNVIRVVKNTNYIDLKEDDRVLQLSNYAFDGSVFDIHGALSNGALLVMIQRENVLQVDQLSELIKNKKITVFFVTTALFNALVDVKPGCFASTRKVLFGGERVSVDHSRRALDYLGQDRIIHVYGPTETTVYASYYFIRQIDQAAVTIPIGKSLTATFLYILDKYLNPVPLGINGEIYIGGTGTARGYLNSPEFTHDKFIKNPFREGDRLYKTGDLARWLPEGNVEFLGRVDHQVKLRGYRIELGEIESQLQKHDGIKDAVVIVTGMGKQRTPAKNPIGKTGESEYENKYLCAYIAPDDHDEEPLSVTALREHLSGELPDYMIPTHFVIVEEFALTANGKIDRKNLPDPQQVALPGSQEYAAPRNAIELELVEICNAVLGRSIIGINENFFEIGGDSIKAIQIASRMYQAGYKIDVTDIFQYPVISELALKVKKLKKVANQEPVTGPLPLTPGQLAFFAGPREDAHRFTQVMVLYSKEAIDEEAIKKTLVKIQENHDILRMVYPREAGEICQRSEGPDHPLSFQAYDYQNRENETAAAAVETGINTLQANINLETGPLMKTALFHLDDGDRLVIVIHQLVIDTVSWKILLEDMDRLYRQYKQGIQPKLSLKTDSFKLWSRKLSEYATSEALLEEKIFWKELEDREVPVIKGDLAETGSDVKETGVISFCLDEKETGLLLGQVNEALGTETEDILLTGLGLAIKNIFGNREVLVALEGSGRQGILPDLDISHTVGWFAHTYPILLDFSYDSDLSRQVMEIKETLRQVPNKGIGYGVLKYLAANRHKEEIHFKLKPQIRFKYLLFPGAPASSLGQESPCFEIARAPVDSMVSTNKPREYELDVFTRLNNERMEISIFFNKNQYKPGTIKALSQRYQNTLGDLIAYCSNRETRELTPSDLTYKKLSIEELEGLKTRYLIEDVYLLSPLQEGMFFHALYQIDVSTDFVQIAFRLEEDLDPGFVEKSLNELFKRHEILRTAFVHEGVRPLQVVLQERKVDFYKQDLREMAPEREKEKYLRAYAEKDRQTPFDLSKDVLMRIAVFQVNDDSYEFIWSFHHILMDGWCTGIIMTEFFEIYNSYRENRPARLSSIKPYRNYFLWLEQRDKKVSQAFWQNYLASYEETVEIPKIKTGKTTKTGYLWQEKGFGLGNQRTLLLDRLAGKNRVTLNTLFQAVWGIIVGHYSNKNDVVYGTVVSGRPAEVEGVETMVGLFINTVPLRIRYERKTVLKDLLQKVQKTAINSEPHHYYPLANIQANSELKQNLLDHILIFENYPLEEQIFGELALHENKKKGQGIRSKLNISDIRSFGQSNYDLNVGVMPGAELSLNFSYNGNVYENQLIERIGKHVLNVLDQVIANDEVTIADIHLLTEEERKEILFDFNHTRTPGSGEFLSKTIHELFRDQVQRGPQQTALSSYLNLVDIYKKSDPEQMGHLCFRKNPFIFKYSNPGFLKTLAVFPPGEENRLFMLRTHRLNYAAVNGEVLWLLDYFDGQTNLKSIFKAISAGNLQFGVFTIEREREEEEFYLGNRTKILVDDNFNRMVQLVKVLSHVNLIELSGYNPAAAALDISWPCEPSFPGDASGGSPRARGRLPLDPHNCSAKHALGDRIKSPVLLLGDRTGHASTGLLYIASYLRRNGIEAYCQWNDTNGTKESLKANVRQLLEKIRPRLVGISMKWFPHMARVLETCKLVKEYDSSITVVVGGNTASYYSEEVIRYDQVDYVIAGDGELPVLKLCSGETDVPNIVYKEANNGKIIKNPISYVQDADHSSDVYFSHLEEIFVRDKDPYIAPYFFIATGKGCSMQCFYCGGCRDAQIKAFNRDKPFMRGAEEVRNDIMAAREYTSTFWFDFDLPGYDSLEYYKTIWEGLDLGNHFCEFYFWKLPGTEFLAYVVTVFKYVYINIDICSLSEPHRLKLTDLKLVKPQPTDKELFALFDQCREYDNVEVVINQITGLPYFSQEDIRRSEETLAKILSRYSFIKAMDWGRLHAQPGAPIVENPDQYGMHSYAKDFADFMYYSQLNLEENKYPELFTFNYPYIYTRDEELNSGITRLYVESNKQIEKYEEEKQELRVFLHMSYRELAERSNRLALVLRDKGVGPEVVVGVMVERSAEMITALLAILKAGGIYLPIDSQYPPTRVSYMLADSQARIVLSQTDLLDRFGELSYQGQVIDISNPSSFSTLTSTCQVSPTNLAYIMYTSGSTGKPKGVMVEHRSVVRLVKNSNFIDLSAGDRLLLTGKFTFDITTFEIWGPLLSGLNLYLVPQEIVLHGKKLKDTLRENQINILHLVPQLFNLLVSESDRGDLDIFAGLDYFLVGGDLVSPEYVNRLKEKFHNLKILHMYGPTENTTFSTFYPVDKPIEGSIPIGKPIVNSSVYVLNSSGVPQPVGAVGELYVGGVGIARGYLNNPVLTYEKFKVSEATSNKKLLRGVQGGGFLEKSPPGRRRQKIYKTGDLACWLPGGNLEFRGRRDHQVKIRGIRVELGEIENELLKHPDIKEAVVITRESGTDEKYLYAYIVMKPHVESTGLEEKLRKHLSHSLPDYMIPIYFVQLDKMPLNPNGKIQRSALPDPVIDTGKEATSPRNELEKKLVNIWSEILAKEQDSIGIDDNFFRVGGHSLKATTLVSRIQKEFNVNVPMTELFKKPSIRLLGEYIGTAAGRHFSLPESNLLLLRRESESINHLFMIHHGTGEVEDYVPFCNQMDIGFNYWGIRADRLENHRPLEKTVKRIAQKYLEKMQTVQPPDRGPYFIAGWSVGGVIAFEMARQLEKQHQDIAFLGLVDAPIPSRWLWWGTKLRMKPGEFNLTSESNLARLLVNAVRKYRPAGKINIPIHYFKARRTVEVKEKKWLKFTTAPVNVYEIPGDHFSIFNKNVGDFVKVFQKVLKEVIHTHVHRKKGTNKK